MIIDSLANAHKYFSLHPSFKAAFDYIGSTDLATKEPGKFDIDAELKGAVISKKGTSVEESIAKFECHDHNIDIQVCLVGTETIGWKPRETCNEPKGEYNAEKDVQFYSDKPDMYFQLKAGQFAILYPNDVHAPMIGEDVITKTVIKVKI